MKKLLAMVLVCLMLMTVCGMAFAEEPTTANGELLDIAQVMVKAAMNKAEEIKVPMVITVMDMDLLLLKYLELLMDSINLVDVIVNN